MAEGGSELFIVDNSISGWTGLEYLAQWTDIAKAFDVATGYFEIGSLLALDGKWQQLDKIRILMGDQVTLKTKRAFAEALRDRTTFLDDSIESEKGENPFLRGVDAIVEALKSGQIECRVYREDKFHAKAYITHAKLDVVGAQALVGSSNFTRPGLTQNIELNIQVQSGREVAQLQRWFEHHWAEAEPVTEEVLSTITRHTALYTPFDVYAKALHAYFGGHELTGGEWDESRSKMFGYLDLYQKEAYWAMMKIAKQFGGAFLCDGVGLGKTFVGLMLIERLVLHENKRVALFAPKAAVEGVWAPHLKKWLPHIGGVGGGADFSNLAIFAHTDLNRGGDFPDRFRRMTELADVVIVDEAHHFRNTGRAGEEDDPWEDLSRYRRLFRILDASERSKSLYLLTATPINNRLSDFRHMVELFSRKDDAYFAKTLGVNNLTAHFNNLEKHLQASLGGQPQAADEGLAVEAEEVLAGDPVFEALVVQRSRAYAKASQIQETGESAIFPVREGPVVADYSIRKAYGNVLDQFEMAFQKQDPLFSLPIYYPLAYYTGPDSDIDPFVENRQKQVVGLIRTQFLKRFESSAHAFECSLDRMLRKLLAFVEVNVEGAADEKRLDRWKRQHAKVLDYHPYTQLGFDLGSAGDGESSADGDEEEDIVPPEFLEAAEVLSRDEYNVDEIIDEVYLDLDEITRFMDVLRTFTPAKDDKLKRLVSLLKTKELAGRKVLIFTEFADTARYLATELAKAGVDGVAELDGGSGVNRAEVIRRFSPYYNGSSSGELAEKGISEIRVLVSTDVLSEGLNLQDATRLINYDLHWNPVRLMQRIGRVDRRMDPETEARLKVDHPELAGDRGTVVYWNFLPPDELERLLLLFEKVTNKTLVISKTLGIEGRKLLTPDDTFDPLKEFNAAYEGTKTRVEDLQLEYQALLRDDSGLADRLDRLPGSVFSGRQQDDGARRGVFLCYSLPAFDQDADAFTYDAGPTRWYFVDADSGDVIEAAPEIADSIRSDPSTPRVTKADEADLVKARKVVNKRIKNSYLKMVGAPLDAPKPRLECWMEVSK
ncbi:MAG: helicase [Actinobacteria bacterium]|nr:helicase [Actinomycetota bacterium]